jgi:hypothetical protein
VAGLSKLNSVTWLESQGRGRRCSRRAGMSGRPKPSNGFRRLPE